MAREDPQFRIRLPAELKAQVEEAARVAGRSLNSEIIHRLKQTLPISLSEGDANAALKMSEAMLAIAGQKPDRETVSKALRLAADGLALLAMSGKDSDDAT